LQVFKACAVSSPISIVRRVRVIFCKERSVASGRSVARGKLVDRLNPRDRSVLSHSSVINNETSEGWTPISVAGKEYAVC
jgi:hypothetical protein